ncbi:DNA replication initiation complex subunit (GINS family) [Streptosporangium becharense]|uniref:DNA replication initiation complex subunit (GINS family) n=1 Tax=Streptosporangium becharense TaxID=1816182 RepID=A0A7W9IM87_9ACTN|nr:hypothetical protein [Streptosporangium becharense]MBB2910192.1 DNA replication initiation complex subunit (GINS family) [Streptosporangium becharense]MBB5822935.1 DNA replication initiation complex subunit (GINS family) [Streptosporangium becharense]
MTDKRDANEETTRQDTPEQDTPETDQPPAGPRGVDGETRVVAERSGADTSFPERPLPADPEDARRTPDEERAGAAGTADQATEGEESGTAQPEVGPAS